MNHHDGATTLAQLHASHCHRLIGVRVRLKSG
jgi:hypothetical protein